MPWCSQTQGTVLSCTNQVEWNFSHLSNQIQIRVCQASSFMKIILMENNYSNDMVIKTCFHNNYQNKSGWTIFCFQLLFPFMYNKIHFYQYYGCTPKLVWKDNCNMIIIVNQLAYLYINKRQTSDFIWPSSITSTES